jgi:hypothetical protein
LLNNWQMAAYWLLFLAAFRREKRVLYRRRQAASRGCQIFHGTWYQNGKKCTKWTQNVPKDDKISQMFVKYSKWPWNISTFSILYNALKNCPKWGFLLWK